jgi:hypothetical protein
MMLTDMPLSTAGGGFPWGLLILGGIIYFLWHKGVIGGPGRYGPRHGGYGDGYPPAPMPPTPNQGQGQGQGPAGSGFRGPRDYFDEWHRQAHEAQGAPAEPPAAPQAPATPNDSSTPGSDTQAR